jgi:hypothetical protein
MATRLYLRSTTWDTNRYKLSTTPGTAVATKTVNTATAAQVQWTDGAGGSAIEWCSDPLSSSATISSAVTFNIWAVESNMSANAGARARLYKVSNDRATWTEMGGGPWDDNVEFPYPTTRAAHSWTGTPTSNNALSAGDRIGVRLFLDDNCGVALVNGYTATLGFDDDVASADGDTYIETVENLTFASNQTVNGVAAAIAATVDVASLLPGAITVAGAAASVVSAVDVAALTAAITLLGQEPQSQFVVGTATVEALSGVPLDLFRFYQRVRRSPHVRM